MRWIAGLLAVLALSHVAWASGPCTRQEFDGDQFTVCRYDPQTDKIGIAWRSAQGAPLFGFPGLKAMLGAESGRVKFAVNAGMFHLGGAPVGLYVANGVRERALNRRTGPGNFHMLPNGVIWIDRNGRATVETAERFARRKADPVLATQSGPMLLFDGRLHPRIQADGPSRLIRNGAGSAPDGAAVFVISETPVSFGKMARYFRDVLRVRDALYLDGAVSSLWDPARNRMDVRARLGPMIWVY